MAEAIGLVAGIIGITTAATQLSIGLYQIARSLKGAGQEVRAIADDTSHLSRVLEELSKHLSEQNLAVTRARSVAEDVIGTCQKIQKDGEALLEVLKPLVEQSQAAYRRVFLSIRWLFEKSKFAYHRDLLQSLKTTLQLLISVISLQTTPDRNMFERLMFEVESLRESVQSGIHNMERRLESPQTIQMLTQTHTSANGLTGPGRQQAIDNRAFSTLEVSEVNEVGEEVDIQRSEPTNNQSELQSIDSDHLDIDHDDDMRGRETSSSVLVGPLALVPYFRAYFVQEKVCAYAANVLENANWNPDRPPTTGQVDAESIPNVAPYQLGSYNNPTSGTATSNSRVSDASPTASSFQIRTPSASEPGARELVEAETQGNASRSVPSLQSGFMELPTSRHNGARQSPQATGPARVVTPTLSSTNLGDDIQSNRSQESEIAQSASASAPSLSHQGLGSESNNALAGSSSPNTAYEALRQPDTNDPDVIKFRDWRGQLINIPFRDCRTPEDLLKCIFNYAYVPTVKSPFWVTKLNNNFGWNDLAIHKGEPLARYSYNRINQLHWEVTRRPDQVIHLRFNDREIGEKFDSRDAPDTSPVTETGDDSEASQKGRLSKWLRRS